MSRDIPNPLYAIAFIAGGITYSFNLYLFAGIVGAWCLHGLYRQQTRSVPAV